MTAVLWLEELDRGTLDQAGGKGANLGEMVKAGLPVPEDPDPGWRSLSPAPARPGRYRRPLPVAGRPAQSSAVQGY